MTISNYVSITITQDSVGVARAGFGVPLILSASAAWVERYRTYTSLAAVAVDFPTTSSPEYLAASTIFSQSPRPEKIAIGRSALKPTQKYLLEVVSVANTTTYSVIVSGQGFVTTTLNFTSDASATNDEIVAGLVAALNGVASKNYTAAAVGAGGSQDVEITGNAAGNWFSVEVLDLNLLKIAQTHADPGVATDLAAIANENNEWYCLLTHFNSNAYVLAAAGWIETQKKIYVVSVNETDSVTQADGASDTIDDLQTAARARTSGMYHPSPAAFLGAALAGRCLPIDPGGETWALKRLSGPAPVKLTATQRANLVARFGNSYESVAGVNVTFQGKMADGDFIDVQRGLDFLEDDIQKSVFEALVGVNKVPYTDRGVALLVAALRGALTRSFLAGIINADFVITFPKVADVSTADKTARLLPDVKFTATLQGAIHKVNVVGVISV